MSKQQAVYVDHMGNDDSVVNAARLSFGVDAKKYTPIQNKSLINYLAYGVSSKDVARILAEMKAGASSQLDGDEALQWAMNLYEEIRMQDRHWTPFAHTAIQIRMKAPIPIRTQCFKHKQGMVENEESRRYISCTPELFIPEYLRSKPVGSIKQGSGEKHKDSDAWLQTYKECAGHAIKTYEAMIADGIAPEQARFVLPQGCMVNWLWTGNLLSFANFYNKRSDSHAQVESQQLAEMVGNIIQPLFPISWSALTRRK